MTKIRALYSNDLKVEMLHESGAKIITHAPKQFGGMESSFSPTDLLAASFVSCVLTLMGMEAKKLGIDIQGTSAEVEKEMSSGAPRRIGRLVIKVQCPHSISHPFRERLEKAAIDCPVHHSLHPDIRKEFEFIWGI